MHAFEHSSSSTSFPSSHCSSPSTVPLPHFGSFSCGFCSFFMHVFEHSSSSTLFPSSHCSSPSTVPLPHFGSFSCGFCSFFMHAFEHSSSSTSFPSSHCSSPSTILLPQTEALLSLSFSHAAIIKAIERQNRKYFLNIVVILILDMKQPVDLLSAYQFWRACAIRPGRIRARKRLLPEAIRRFFSN